MASGITEKRYNRHTRSETKPFVGLNSEKLSNLAILTKFGRGEALGVSSEAF